MVAVYFFTYIGFMVSSVYPIILNPPQYPIQEVVLALCSVVVEVTCLFSLGSGPSWACCPAHSPTEEALVFFLSLFDLHWISVNRPGNSSQLTACC